MILAIAIILYLVLPHPIDYVVLGLGCVGELGEIVWGRRLARRWRPKTGPEAMIGTDARVVEECRPTGRVRVRGELWQARCPDGADVGQTVRIVAIDGLELTVAPAPDGDPGSATDAAGT